MREQLKKALVLLGVAALTWTIGVYAQGTIQPGAGTLVLPNEGQQTMANSISVAIASDQSTFAVQAAIDELPAASALANNMANPTTALVGAVLMCQDAGSLIDFCVSGDATHGSAVIATGPHPLLDAETALSTRALVADGQAARSVGGIDGVQIVRPNTGLEDIVVGNNSNIDGASTELIPTSGSGVKTYLGSITCTNTSTTGIYVELKSGTTVRWRIPVPAAAASDVNGYTFKFDPPLSPNAANEAWNTDGSAAITTLYCSGNGFKSKI